MSIEKSSTKMSEVSRMIRKVLVDNNKILATATTELTLAEDKRVRNSYFGISWTPSEKLIKTLNKYNDHLKKSQNDDGFYIRDSLNLLSKIHRRVYECSLNPILRSYDYQNKSINDLLHPIFNSLRINVSNINDILKENLCGSFLTEYNMLFNHYSKISK